jgi:diguanylate cyclase (GGDEF)-like protein
MMQPGWQKREERRVAALHRYSILDTPPEPQFDRIARIAAELLQTPISLVTLIDSTRQWFKAKHGLDAVETARSDAFCNHAIEGHDVMVVENALDDQRFAGNPYVTASPNIRFYAGAPLRNKEGYNLGTLCVIDQKPRHISPQQQHILEDLAAIVVDELELHHANIELQRLATTDALTGVNNRRQFLHLAETESLRGARYQQPLSVLMVDIDHFKKVNDTYGHEGGDRALVAVATAMRGALRPEAIVGRLGGEEFAVLLPQADKKAALTAAERLRQGVERLSLDIDGASLRITVSVGAAQVGAARVGAARVEGGQVDGSQAFEAALQRADEALYAAKKNGRNRVCTS